MQEISLDGLLFTSPDGFHVLTDEERSGMHTPWKGPWTGIRDPERHILVTAGVRQAGWLASLLLSARDLAGRTEKQISRAMAPYGYRAGDRVERMIAGERAFGFRYAYDADGDQISGVYGDTLILLNDGRWKCIRGNYVSYVEP